MTLRIALAVSTIAACAAPPPAAAPRSTPPATTAPPPIETAFQEERPVASRFETRTIGHDVDERAPRYTGRRVNLDMKSVDVQEALRLLADVGKVNIVVAGEISGSITMKLADVPWDQALHLIAATKNLSVERDGNVYVVQAMK